MASVSPLRSQLPLARFAARWDWRHGAFFVGVPLLIAIYAGLNNWAVVELAGIGGSIVFYLAHAFVPWWTSCGVTRAWMEVLRPWQPPQLVLLLLGTLTACLLIAPYTNWLTGAFEARWIGALDNHSLTPFSMAEFLGYAIRASVIWVIINVLFDRFLSLPRYRYEAPQAEVDARRAPAARGAAIPQFLERLPVKVTGQDVLALKAEQHYVRVYTAQRHFMTLCRFSDAVAQLDPDRGLQVHRSYWVRKTSIKALRRGTKKLIVEMDSSLRVPVSGPYRELVLQVAREQGIQILPLR